MFYPTHGANPHYLYEKYKLDLPKEHIDFSVNVNPFAPPYNLLNYQEHFEEWLSEYPDPELTTLKKAISTKDGVGMDHLFIGNGAAQCIFLLAQYFQGKRVGIIQPTFVEYKQAAQLFNCQVLDFFLSRENNWDLT